MRRFPRNVSVICLDFNPRTPVGCDSGGCRKIALLRVFQSTHPSGVRLFVPVCVGICLIISIHAPQWGATFADIASRVVYKISIHAPQWGATQTVGRPGLVHGISIHAPQWGATSLRWRWSPHPSNFNPRTPVGCDDGSNLKGYLQTISIHAPQWGATPHYRRIRVHCLHFNPRTPVGCDRARPMSRTAMRYFNPRTPVGCDVRADGGTVREDISIHAPQWGATFWMASRTVQW